MISENELDEVEGAFLPHSWGVVSYSSDGRELVWYCSRCGVTKAKKIPETGGCAASMKGLFDGE